MPKTGLEQSKEKRPKPTILTPAPAVRWYNKFEVEHVQPIDRKSPFNQPVETGSQEFQQLLDQERKLLYVGLTQALHHLQRRRPGVDFQPAAGQATAAPAGGVRTALRWGGFLAEFKLKERSWLHWLAGNCLNPESQPRPWMFSEKG